MRTKNLYKMSTAAFLFFAVLLATVFLQVSPFNSQLHARTSTLSVFDQFRPDASLELESLEQVNEINEHSLKFYEINPSEELRD